MVDSRKARGILIVYTEGCMATKIQKWGNSLGVRIPKALAEQVIATGLWRLGVTETLAREVLRLSEELGNALGDKETALGNWSILLDERDQWHKDRDALRAALEELLAVCDCDDPCSCGAIAEQKVRAALDGEGG